MKGEHMVNKKEQYVRKYMIMNDEPSIDCTSRRVGFYNDNERMCDLEELPCEVLDGKNK